VVRSSPGIATGVREVDIRDCFYPSCLMFLSKDTHQVITRCWFVRFGGIFVGVERSFAFSIPAGDVLATAATRDGRFRSGAEHFREGVVCSGLVASWIREIVN
jgi:hypothetical protein